MGLSKNSASFKLLRDMLNLSTKPFSLAIETLANRFAERHYGKYKVNNCNPVICQICERFQQIIYYLDLWGLDVDSGLVTKFTQEFLNTNCIFRKILVGQVIQFINI